MKKLKLAEHIAKVKKEMPLKRRIKFELWGIWFKIEHKFRQITQICPHDSSAGAVGGKEHFCLDCRKTIPNPDYIEEKKALKKLKKKKI